MPITSYWYSRWTRAEAIKGLQGWRVSLIPTTSLSYSWALKNLRFNSPTTSKFDGSFNATRCSAISMSFLRTPWMRTCLSSNQRMDRSYHSSLATISATYSLTVTRVIRRPRSCARSKRSILSNILAYNILGLWIPSMEWSLSSTVLRQHPCKQGSIPQLSRNLANPQVASKESTIGHNKINIISRETIINSPSNTLMMTMSTLGETMARRMAAVVTSISSPSTSKELNTKCTINPKSLLRDSTKRTTMRRGRCLAMNDTTVHDIALESRFNVYSSHLWVPFVWPLHSLIYSYLLSRCNI